MSGRPGPAQFHSPMYSRYREMYNLTWSVESFPPIEEIRLLYRKLMVSGMDRFASPMGGTFLVGRGFRTFWSRKSIHIQRIPEQRSWNARVTCAFTTSTMFALRPTTYHLGIPVGKQILHSDSGDDSPKLQFHLARDLFIHQPNKLQSIALHSCCAVVTQRFSHEISLIRQNDSTTNCPEDFRM